MKKLLEKLFPVILDVTFAILFIIAVSATLFLTQELGFILTFLNINVYIKYAMLVYCSINIYILTAGVLNRIIVREFKPGRARLNINKKFVNWKLSWHCYSLVFMFFKTYLQYNKVIRYLFFRLMRVNLHLSSGIADTVDMQDANNLITIGRNAFLGSEVLLASHFVLGTDIIVFKPISIGDNSAIGARCSVACGVTIGKNVILGFGTMVSMGAIIGDNTKIGAVSIINTNVKIGSNCIIGDNVKIISNVEIPDGTKVPNNCIISDINDVKSLVGISL